MSKKHNEYIAVFDSGVGGITVLHEALKHLPNEQFIYYADSANVPYGDKSPEKVRRLIEDAFQGLVTYPLKAVVLACNTATSIAADSLRRKYNFPIIGMEPAIKPALLNADEGKVLVLGTKLTLAEEKFNNLVKQFDRSNRIDSLPFPELVDFAEEYDFNSALVKKTIREKFKQINWAEYYAIVLGCTHFLYFKKTFKKMLPKQISIFDGNQGTVKHLLDFIKPTTHHSEQEIVCLLSGMKVSNEAITPFLNYLDEKSFRHIHKKD